MLYIMCLV